jgi:hypothetical protein
MERMIMAWEIGIGLGAVVRYKYDSISIENREVAWNHLEGIQH